MIAYDGYEGSKKVTFDIMLYISLSDFFVV